MLHASHCELAGNFLNSLKMRATCKYAVQCDCISLHFAASDTIVHMINSSLQYSNTYTVNWCTDAVQCYTPLFVDVIGQVLVGIVGGRAINASESVGWRVDADCSER